MNPNISPAEIAAFFLSCAITAAGWIYLAVRVRRHVRSSRIPSP